jgi:beta-lactamase family protein
MRAILESSPKLARFLADAAEWRLQAVLGTVEPGRDGRPRLVQEGFRADAEYFYPASAVKLLAAAAALERLGELRAETGLPLGADTPLAYHPLFPGDELADRDPSNLEGGAITLRHEIRKLFLVSDNEAFNRLYEFLGQDRLAQSLNRAGLPQARLVNRLARPMSAEDNRRMPRIDFLNADGAVLYTLPERRSPPLPEPSPVPGLLVGDAWLTNDEPQRRVEGPMDFMQKNRVTLVDLQRALCMIVQPEVDCGGSGFRLGEEDRALLRDPMRTLAVDSRNPVYDRAEHPDDEVKPFRPGLLRVLPAERLEVYNKVGWSYGFSIDTAWIVDRRTGRSFFLAATLYTNADGVINDDQYEYKTVAWPFLADLAEAAARYLWR